MTKPTIVQSTQPGCFRCGIPYESVTLHRGGSNAVADLSTYTEPIWSPRCSCWTAQPQPDEPDALGKIGVLLLEFAEADHHFDHPEETDEVAVLAERWERALDPIRQVAYRIRLGVHGKTKAKCIADLANALRDLTPEEEEMGQ